MGRVLNVWLVSSWNSRRAVWLGVSRSSRFPPKRFHFSPSEERCSQGRIPSTTQDRGVCVVFRSSVVRREVVRESGLTKKIWCRVVVGLLLAYSRVV